MEGHQVTWNTNVSYEDLVKQCPFLSQRASLPLENKLGDDIKIPEIQISKSKKKRLKKRLKAISLSNKTNTPENLHQSSEAGSEMSSKPKVSSVNDARKHETEKPKRACDVVDGELNISHPRISRESILTEKEIKKKSKQSKKDVHKDEHNSITQKAKSPISIKPPQSSAKVSQQKHSDAFTQQKVSLTKQSEIIDSVQDKTCSVIAQTKIDDSVKSREEILAERDAKKKAKQLAKQKNVDKSKDASIEKTLPETKKDINVVADIVREKNTPVVSNAKIDSDINKSRGDVIAEREAKKKAKQLAKEKKVDKSQESSENEKNKTDVTVHMVVTKLENKIEMKNDNKTGENTELVEKSKAQLKAERRAKQEAQRAAKEAGKQQKKVAVENKENQVVKIAEKKPVISKEISKDLKTSSKGKIVSQQRIKLFSHLHVGQKPSQTQLNPNVHPSVIELGIKYSSRIINGSNARCVALLNCLKEVIHDYITPAEKEFSRGLESKLGELTNYLNQYRPFAVSMTNALRHIKSHLTQLPNNVSDDEAKRKLLDVIDTFIREQIDVAGEAICESVKNKITNGDIILIYSCSSLLYRILTESYRSGRKFSVIVVDGGPWFEGREMLRKLVEAGLKCSYVQISSLSFIVRQATKVLIGAHALLANGCVMSRAGSALVALAAQAYSVPVLVCCETYKFCERVQTDAFVYNELGSPDDLAKEDVRLCDWQSLTFLTPLSIVYDITPPDLVTAVVTEIAILPCTSVPVILRVKPSDVVS